MDKDSSKRLKQMVDVTIDFVELVSKYLGETIATILPWLNRHKKCLLSYVSTVDIGRTKCEVLIASRLFV